ncbi:methyltransferase domain-containing protein [Cohnella sp. CFH 77786]|uniref:class I SAM-dependent DNA methyltransferase n=1 Tax=Cohnella sp. CFH 77786 TaxID=2662265 RepID=UPI001C60EA6E|nr:class I SAM-dependent methyltransferase [Cohnella sp. CFH 77786]MBW5444963.1 methyltransferase domain-containing protein [Cohnella sp. CFH 77786]
MRSYREFAAVYDRLMEEMPYAEWLSFARRCFERYGIPKSVVDLGCGTGNISIPLAKSGFEVFGIDLSAEMLAIARSKWDEPPAGGTRGGSGSIRWLQQDMRDWDLPKPVDAVISFCDCLNYLTEAEDVVRTFRRTYEGLAPGGLFVFDVHAPRTLERYAEEQPFVYDERDVAYLWTSEYDSGEGIIRHDLTFFVLDESVGSASGLYRRFTESHAQRAYDPDWLADRLAEVGFELLHRAADFAWEAPDEESERLFYAARKPS